MRQTVMSRAVMMRQTVTWFAFAGLFLVVCGCGGQPSAPVSKLPPNMPGGGAAAGNAGGPPPPENRPVPAMGGGGAPAAGAAAPPAAPPAAESVGATDIFGNQLAPRERPVAAMGGGGAPAAGGSSASSGTANNNRPGGNSGSTAPIGLANGLYPQGMTGSSGGGEGAIAGGLQNGLYPQFASTGAPSNFGSASGTTGNAPPAAASALAGDNAGGATAAAAGSAVEFFETAKELFKEGDDTAAARNLYAYLLAKEDAFEEYPLQWYPGLKQPRAFLRIGVGVTYSRPRDFDGKPPVIGDPVASDRGSGRRGNAPQGSDDGILGASGANPGGAGGGSNSPYSNVDTSTPAGFLLYYTGDYVEKLYQELNTRRKGTQTQFGKILAQFPERTPSTPAPSQNENVSSQPFPPQGGPPANRPTIALGGGPGGGGGGPPAGGGGAGAGGGGGAGQANNANANRNARNARKLVDLWSGSNASAPERLTTGTLTPGVICLGEGKKEELFSRAKKFGVDVVLLFDVKVGEARGENYSTTTLRLFNVDNPEEQLALGRQLRSNVVMEARDDGKADPVVSELSRVLEEYMDQNLAAQDLPKSLTQENVSKRVDLVLAGAIDDPLKAAVEVIGFYRVGLLPEDKVVEALNKLVGEDLTDTILNGNEADRVAALRKLVDED